MATEYTIGEAAKELSVTTRTLRHWDNCGLLQPSWRTLGDYRLYTDDDLNTARKILIYRATGASLADIAHMLHHPEDAATYLAAQRDKLVDGIGELRAKMRAVDALLQGETMTRDDVAAWKNEWASHRDEAEHHWGTTTAWVQADNRTAQMGAHDWEEMKDLHDQLVADLQTAQQQGVAPGSAEARELVERHRAWVNRTYDCDRQRQLLLARTYIDDERFERSYAGTASYLLTLVEAQAREEGIDLDHATWD